MKRGMRRSQNPYDEGSDEFALWEDGYLNIMSVPEKDLQEACEKVFES